MSKVLYFTVWYDEKNAKRKEELVTCLRKTAESDDIDEIYLLSEIDELPFTHKKIQLRVKPERATYSDLFEFANTVSKHNEDIVIISNTDIYPSKGVRKYLDLLTPTHAFLLSRWDEDEKGEYKYFGRKDSQDTWIFRSPIKFIQGNFPTGRGGCDNRIAHEIQKAGYTTSNPSKTIQFNHLHLSKVRSYTSGVDAIPPPYALIDPTDILGNPVNKAPVAQNKAPGTSAPIMSMKKKVNRVLHVGFEQPPLERALAKAFPAYNFIKWTDYQSNLPELRKLILQSHLKQPAELIFIHIQTAGVIDDLTISRLRNMHPNIDPIIVNWTGDVRAPLPQWYIDLGKQIDITLFSNVNDVLTARSKGVTSDYLQIGFDTQIFTPGKPVKQWPEIVFLGNNYPNSFPLSPLRESMVKLLDSTYGKRFGVYGGNWKTAKGNLMNSIQDEVDCYRGCKIAINLSHFDYERYSSDRIFRIMGSGALCLTRIYPGIEKDFSVDESHLDTWKDFPELIRKIDDYLEKPTPRAIIAEKGRIHVHTNHTWEKRIEELKTILNLA